MEQWKDIVWYEWLYQVSNLGNVRKIKIIVMKQKLTKLWYKRIQLVKDKKPKSHNVHRLVAKSFIDNEDLKPVVNHINWIKHDNRVENLEWNTKSENTLHYFNVLKWKHSMTWKFWKDNHHSKPVNQYDLNGNFIKEWGWTREIERELWIPHTNISSCCLKNKHNKTCWWYKWEFKI